MAIPRVAKENILDAIMQFEADLSPRDEWKNSEGNGAQVWGLVHDASAAGFDPVGPTLLRRGCFHDAQFV